MPSYGQGQVPLTGGRTFGEIAQDALQLIRSDLGMSLSTFDSIRNDRVEFMRLYKEQSQSSGDMVLHGAVPLTVEAVDTARADLYDSLMRTWPMARPLARQRRERQIERQITRMQTYQLDQNKGRRNVYHLCTNALILGESPFKCFYWEDWDRQSVVSPVSHYQCPNCGFQDDLVEFDIANGLTPLYQGATDPTEAPPACPECGFFLFPTNPVEDGHGRMVPEVKAERRVTRDVLLYKGPGLQVFDTLDWFPHPNKKEPDDHYAQIFRRRVQVEELFERQWESKKYVDGGEMNDAALQRLLDKVALDKGVDDIEAAVEGKTLSIEQAETLKEYRDSLDHINTGGGRPDRGVLTVTEWTGMLDVGRLTDEDDKRYFEGRRRMCEVWAVGTEVVKIAPLPYYERRPSVGMAKIAGLPWELFGTGIVEMGAMTQYAANHLLSSMLTEFKMHAHRHVIARANAFGGESAPSFEPGGLTWVEQGDKLSDQVMVVGGENVPTSYHAILQLFTELHQMATGINDIRKGHALVKEMKATEANLLAQAGAMKATMMRHVFADTTVIPLHEMFLRINRNFIDAEYAGWVLGKDGYQAFNFRVTPAEVAVQVHFHVDSLVHETNRQQQRMELHDLLLISTKAPELIPVTKLIFLDLARLYAVENLEEYEDTLRNAVMQQGGAPGAPPGMPPGTDRANARGNPQSRGRTEPTKPATPGPMAMRRAG